MSKVLILSGAGISAESGISTFRGGDGLWENYRIEDVCSAGCFQNNKEATKSFYDARRADIKDKEANYAHKVIANLKQNHPNEISVLTQNVDDLFEKAGLKRDEVVHLHGFLKELRCTQCSEIVDIGYIPQDEAYPNGCPKCCGDLRPNIVFFGESAPKYQILTEELNKCSMIVVIGTSGYVLDVTYFAQLTNYSILNNLEKSEAIDDRYFTKVYYSKATEAISHIAEDIEEFLANT